MLKAENILRNFDEFENFDNGFSDRQMQDMKSVYADIKEQVSAYNGGQNGKENAEIDFSDVEFQIELLRTDEINLDYILALILEKYKESENIDKLKDEIRRVIRSSIGTRAKEDLVIEFINNTKISDLKNNEDILESFYSFARKRKDDRIKKFISDEFLKKDAERFIEKSISKGYVSQNGPELDNILPPISRRGGAREKKKQELLEKIRNMVDVFVGI
ncbi:deoxyribonuclease HsdR [uncultured Peptoniphilus sp.]|uniref:type I restriction endonuclease subunit R, EcoR124 family n=1 Tax=uncultured Peptoniphilus sp. TaxID=254354 RepID=UPI0028050307|nr:deoxyribonuclease HsdR [uncultured Peptoniphilus sp.]